MFYGFEKLGNVYICAADDFSEYDDLSHRLDDDSVGYDRVGVLAMFGEDFDGFRLPPISINFEGTCPVVFQTLSKAGLLDMEKKMLSAREKETRLREIEEAYRGQDERREIRKSDPTVTEDPSRRVTYAEILGIDKHDPWDNRTEEQKNKVKNVINTAKKDDTLTDDSFGGDKNAKVRRINARDVDGKIVIDDVLAVKGLFETEEEIKITDPDYHIAEKDYVRVYFRVDVARCAVEKVNEILTRGGFRLPRIYKSRDVGDGCWIVFVKKEWAKDACDILVGEGLGAILVGVNSYGEPLVEDNVAEVLDSRGETKPRPWTDKNDLYNEAERSKISGKEFYFHIAERGKFSTVYVSPISWFDDNGGLFAEMLPIEHLFPPKTVQVSPGVFENDEQRFDAMGAMVRRKNMAESLLFNMFVLNNFR